MSFQGTLGSTLKAFTEAEKDLASDLAKRPDKVHAELSFAHYHWQRFSFTCGFAFKVNTAGIEASIFLVGAAYIQNRSLLLGRMRCQPDVFRRRLYRL